MKLRPVIGVSLIILIIISSFSLLFFLNTIIQTNNVSQNTQPIELADEIPLQSSGILSIEEGKFNGTGDLMFAEKFGNIAISEQAIQTNSSFEMDTQDWNGTSMTVNVSNIEAIHSTMGELDLLTTTNLQIAYFLAQPFYMEFAYGLLEGISVYLKFNVFTQAPPQDLIVRVWNAREPAAVKPDTNMYEQQFDIGGTGDPTGYSDWLSLTFTTPVTLNTSNTVNNTFFISLSAKGSATDLEWWGANDTGMSTDGVDEFLVWESADGTNWNQNSFDFSLNTSLTVAASPSQIDLAINGTSVVDIGVGAGFYFVDFPEPRSGILSFFVTANTTVTFDLDGILSILHVQYFNSNFLIRGGWSYSKWNVTQDISFFMNAFDLGINLSIPLWNVERVDLNGIGHSNWIIIESPNSCLISILNAANGTWMVECNSSNYLQGITLVKGGVQVSEVNITDTVDIYGNFSKSLKTGFANLTIYPQYEANYSDSITDIIGNDTIQFQPWEIMQYARDNPGFFGVQITWFNGTAVGLNSTTLTVQNVPTNLTLLSHTDSVESGVSVIAFVNFTAKSTGEPLVGATLIVKNSTDSTVWGLSNIKKDYSNGTYQIEILTFGLGNGIYWFSINLSKTFYYSSEICNIQITIGGGSSNISVTAPNCFGLEYINDSFAIANPIPYYGSNVKVGIYYFANDTLEPLSSGIITSSWIGGGPAVSWIPTFFGYYNITIDVSGFHSGTNQTLILQVQQAGYVKATLNIIIPIKQLPTQITPEQPLYNKYLEDSLTVFAVYEDTFNEKSIPEVYDLNGNFTIKIGNLTDNMSLVLPTVGLFKYDLVLSTLGIEEDRTYNITICAFSSEHEFSLLNVSLYIIPKINVSLTLLGVPNYVLAGDQFKIYANLALVNGTPILNTPLKFRVISDLGTNEFTLLTNGSGIASLPVEINQDTNTFQIEVEYSGTTTNKNSSVLSSIVPVITLNSSVILSPLPHELRYGDLLECNATLYINGTPVADELVTFIFSYTGSDRVDRRTGATDNSGIASVSIEVPSGISKIFIRVEYDGLIYVEGNSTQAEINTISLMTLIWRYAPIWLTIVIGSVGSLLVYKYGYKRPKARKLKSKWQLSAQKYIDATNMSYLMIILKGAGVSVYNYSFKEEEIDYQLMGGFLTALTTFQRELVKTDGKSMLDTGEWEINYQEFKIFAISGEFAQFVLILEGPISDHLKEDLLRFAMDVERLHAPQFIKFRGDVSVFQPINSLILKYFHKEWLVPQYARELSPTDLKQLSDLERQIINLGIFYTLEHGYFYIDNLLKNALQMLKAERNQILDGIHNLMQKQHFTTSRISLIID